MKRALSLLLALLPSVAWGAVEDFTDWTEVDPADFLTVTETAVEAVDVHRNSTCYVIQDFGAGHFTDFTARFEWTGTTHVGTNSFLMAFALVNNVGDWQWNYYSNSFGIRWGYSGSSGDYRLWMVHQAPTYTDTYTQSDTLSASTKYYVEVSRDYDGGNGAGEYTMRICTGAYYGEQGATLVDTQTLTVPSGQQAAYRYAAVTLSRNNASGTHSYIGGTIENLEFIDEEPEPEPQPPAKVSGHSPAHEATNVLPGAQLTWSVASGATSYDVYFGLATGDIEDQFIRNQSNRTYLPTLAYATEYQWRIDSRNAVGATQGDVLTFTTAEEPPPPGSGDYEDFGADYTLVDTTGTILVDDYMATMVETPGQGTTILYKDFTAGYLGGNLTIRFETTLVTRPNAAFATCFVLSNQVANWRSFYLNQAGESQYMVWYISGTQPQLRMGYTGTTTSSTSINLNHDQLYYVTWVRDYDVDTMTAYICTAAHYGDPGAVLVGTLSRAIVRREAFRYVSLVQNDPQAGSSLRVTMVMDRMEISTPGETGEPPGEPGEPGATGPYYVSPTGSDSFPGTEAQPFRTIAFALANGTLNANESYNVIHLLPGDHGNLSLTSKTWASNSWTNEWRIQGRSNAYLTGLTVSGFHDAFLDFNDVDVTRTTAHAQSGRMVNLANTSDLRIRGGTITGWWSTTDAALTTGYSIYISATGAGYIENIEIDGVTTNYSWDSIVIQGGGANSVRDGLVVKNCTIRNWNQSGIYALWNQAARASNDPVEWLYNTIVEMTVSRVSSSTTGAPHPSGLQVRADNLTIRGNRISNFGGSGGVRWYEAYGPFSNMTFEDNIIYAPAGISTVAAFFQCGESVRIVNNTFVSALRPDNTLAAWRYVGAVTVGVSSAVQTPDIEFANNIVVAILDLGGTSLDVIDGGNNLLYSVWRAGAWQSTNEPNDVIVVKGVTGPIESGWTQTSFETSGEVFVGASNFDAYFATSGTRPFDYTVFNLPSTSPAVDAGWPSKASTYDVLGLARDGSPDIGAFEYRTGIPPAKARDPSPAHGATNVDPAALLTWQGVADNYDVYVGTSPSVLVFQGNQQDRSLIYSLAYATTYYWRVDPNNEYGLTTGDVWSFTTAAIPIPGMPSGPSPANGATNVAVSRSLTWLPTPNAVSYDVFLNGVYYGAVTSTSVPVSLSHDTPYTWRVEAINGYGRTVGPTWSFRTAAAGVVDPGVPTMPDLPSVGWRVEAPLSVANRPDRATGRYQTPYEGLQGVQFVRLDGEMGPTVIDPHLCGYLEGIVIAAEGDDPQWSLIVEDAWGGLLFEAHDLNMLEGVVRYDGQRLPFVGGLKVTVGNLDTTAPVRVLFLVREAYTR